MNKLLRKFIFWCHLVTGVSAGLVILTMSVTGVLLTYEKQIISWADMRGYQVSQPAGVASRLSVETLLAKAREARPDIAPTTITLRSDTAAPAAIGLTGGRNIFVNPYNGEVLGEGARGVRNFFHIVTDIHRWLGAHGENRAVARAITGACNLGFLFIVTGGFYLWWPRNITWQQVKNVIWFKRGLSAKARDFNWHNVIGLWSFVPLFIVVLSATVISYPWAGNLVYRVVGEAPPPRTAPVPQRSGAERNKEVISMDGIDRTWMRAEQQVSGWQSISLRLPNTPNTPLAYTIDQGYPGEPHKRAQLIIDRKTAEVVRWEPFSSLTRGRQLRSILRFAHTGEVGGIIGQTIAGIASLGAVFLVWTGLSLAWRRFRAWTLRRSKEPVQTATPLPDLVSESRGSES